MTAVTKDKTGGKYPVLTEEGVNGVTVGNGVPDSGRTGYSDC